MQILESWCLCHPRLLSMPLENISMVAMLFVVKGISSLSLLGQKAASTLQCIHIIHIFISIMRNSYLHCGRSTQFLVYSFIIHSKAGAVVNRVFLNSFFYCNVYSDVSLLLMVKLSMFIYSSVWIWLKPDCKLPTFISVAFTMQWDIVSHIIHFYVITLG